MSEEPKYTVGHVAELLGSSDAFEGMPRKQALAVAQIMTMQSFAAGECIVQQGQASAGKLILIVAGHVRVTSYLPGAVDHPSRQLVFREAKPGHLLGEVSFIDCEPHSATCVAQTDLHVAVLERSDMALLMQDNPLAAAQLMAGLLRLMAQRLRNANRNVIALTLSSGKGERGAGQLADTRPAPLKAV